MGNNSYTAARNQTPSPGRALEHMFSICVQNISSPWQYYDAGIIASILWRGKLRFPAGAQAGIWSKFSDSKAGAPTLHRLHHSHQDRREGWLPMRRDGMVGYNLGGIKQCLKSGGKNGEKTAWTQPQFSHGSTVINGRAPQQVSRVGKNRWATALGTQCQSKGVKHLLTMRAVRNCWHRLLTQWALQHPREGRKQLVGCHRGEGNMPLRSCPTVCFG